MGFVNQVTDSIGITDTKKSGSLLDQAVNIVSDPGKALNDAGTKVSKAVNDIGTAIDKTVPGGLPMVAAATATYFGLPALSGGEAGSLVSAGAADAAGTAAAATPAATSTGIFANPVYGASGLGASTAAAPAAAGIFSTPVFGASGLGAAPAASAADAMLSGLGGEYAGGLGATGALTGGVSDAAALGGEYAGGLGATGALTGGISDPRELGGEYGSPTTTTTPSTPGLLDKAKQFLTGNIGNTGLTGAGALTGAAGLAALLSLLRSDSARYGVPGRATYSGPLSQMRYNPSSYQPTRVDPNMFRPQPGSVTTVADQQAMNRFAPMRSPFMGMNPFMARNPYMPMYDPYAQFAKGGSVKPKYTGQAQLSAMDPWERALAEYGNAAYQAQMPVGPAAAPATNVPELGQLNMAEGGHLGDYSDGGRLLRGPGDGVSDSIPASIGGKRPARLADGEFVVPARIVSELGNGSTDAGARQLYAMMDRIQNRRGKTVGKKKVAVDSKASKDLPA